MEQLSRKDGFTAEDRRRNKNNPGIDSATVSLRPYRSFGAVAGAGKSQSASIRSRQRRISKPRQGDKYCRLFIRTGL